LPKLETISKPRTQFRAMALILLLACVGVVFAAFNLVASKDSRSSETLIPANYIADELLGFYSNAEAATGYYTSAINRGETRRKKLIFNPKIVTFKRINIPGLQGAAIISEWKYLFGDSPEKLYMVWTFQNYDYGKPGNLGNPDNIGKAVMQAYIVKSEIGLGSLATDSTLSIDDLSGFGEKCVFHHKLSIQTGLSYWFKPTSKCAVKGRLSFRNRSLYFALSGQAEDGTVFLGRYGSDSTQYKKITNLETHLQYYRQFE